MHTVERKSSGSAFQRVGPARENERLTKRVNEWNRLSADCVGASSVNMFKNKIDMYLRRAGYI